MTPMTELMPGQFERIARIARHRWGLALTERKRSLVGNRLGSLLRGSRFSGVDAYLEYLEQDAGHEDMLAFFDVLSTNVTSFFRDPAHFEYLERQFYTPLARGDTTIPGRRIRIWSAGCSIGCEPCTLAMNALESLPDGQQWDVRILATDLSSSAVQQARAARYERRLIEHIPPDLVRKYFSPDPADPGRSVAGDRLRRMISVARMNLMEHWPMRGPFDVIFCRNVMIYFDAPTRLQLVRRFYDILSPGGVFAVGSAETLSGLDVPFRAVQASVYRK